MLQILGLQPQISKVFLNHYKHFFLTVGQNNFDNKIPVLCDIKTGFFFVFVPNPNHNTWF